MKKIIHIILLTGVFTSFFCSCNDDFANNIFPDRYIKILSLKETGIKDITMNTTQQQVVDSILILKGGGRPNSTSNMGLKVLSREEAAAIGGYEVSNIRLIPTDSYDVSQGQNIKLEENEDHKYVPITFYPIEIYAAMDEEEQEGLVWVLPLALESSSDTINDSRNKLLIRFEVNRPLVEWEIIEDENAEIALQTLDVPLKLKISHSEDNVLDFTVGLSHTENENLVNRYNDSLGTNYALLPNNTYNLSDFSFNAGDREAQSTLQLRRAGLQQDKTYLLPLKLSELSVDNIEKTNRVKYIVVTNPKYVYRDVQRNDWKVVFVNNQQRWRAPDFFATSLIDGKIETAWATKWDGAIPTWDDYDYGAMDYWGYHMFWERRDIPNIVIVIDMGKEVNFGAVGVGQGTLDMGDRDLKSCEFYLSDSFKFIADGDLENYKNVNKGNTWNLAITYNNIPNVGGGPYWYHLHESSTVSNVPKGRYLKIRPTASHRANNLVSFSELYVKELISIDGNPVQ